MYKSITYENNEVAYQIFGHQQPVIMLIHGFPEDGTIFKFQYEFLKDNFRVIVPDLPGSGNSAFNPLLKTVEDFAQVLQQILQAENVAQCLMLGHSMGGYITLAFAEKYPNYLLGLGLIHSTAYADSEEKKENRRRAIDLMEKYGGAHFLKSVVPSLFGDQFKTQHQSVIDGLIEKGKTFETKALQQYYSIMIHRKDRTATLQNLKIPVLFIIGEKDQAISPNDVLEQASIPKISYIKVLPTAAHMGFLENKTLVNKTIAAFATL